MGITINHSLDELQLLDLQDQGYTTLSLYYSNTPEGPYLDSSVTPDPATLAAAVTAGLPYQFSFSFSSGNASQWFKVVASDGSSISDLRDSQPFHGGGGTSLQVIRQRIGKLTNTMYVGTTTSNGAADGSTAIANYAKFTRWRDDYFGGGTGIDGWIFNLPDDEEWTVVSDWTQSSGTFGLTPSATGQILSGTSFEVMNRWSPDEYRDAINWAIVNCYPILSKPVIETSVLTEEDIFSYAIPNSIKILNKVEIERNNTDTTITDSRTRGHPWRQIAYYPVDDSLNRSIEFKRELDDGRRIRLTGTTTLSQLYYDSDFVEIVDPHVDLIVFYAAYRLYTLLTNTDAASDVDRARAQAEIYLRMYEEAKRTKATRRKSKKIWSHDPMWNSY